MRWPLIFVTVLMLAGCATESTEAEQQPTSNPYDALVGQWRLDCAAVINASAPTPWTDTENLAFERCLLQHLMLYVAALPPKQEPQTRFIPYPTYVPQQQPLLQPEPPPTRLNCRPSGYDYGYGQQLICR